MDILDPTVPLNLNDPPWKIYSRNGNLPPQFVGEDAVLKNSSITEGCKIEGTVENSIIFPGVTVEKGAVINNSVIMPECVIGEGAVVEYSIVASNVTIGKDAQVGYNKKVLRPGEHQEISVVGQDLVVGEGAIVPAGAVVSENVTPESNEKEA